MTNIRKWFGFKGDYDKSSPINKCVDGLLKMYSDGLKLYYSMPLATSYKDIVNLNAGELSIDRKHFQKWLIDKGFPYLTELSSMKLPEDDQLIAKIEFDKYILGEELGMDYPDELRSSLIGIVNDVPVYVAEAKNINVWGDGI